MNVLSGKKIIFLGSSVTYGSAAGGVSFADFLGERDQVQVVKEAVSGTTLVDEDKESYINRMKQLNETNVDLLICQLSTNDAAQGKQLGSVSVSKNLNEFDTKTVAGAIEYVIGYAKETWDCPVLFYTSPKFDWIDYQKMVDLLMQIKDKWGIGIIDLWDDAAFNDITDEQRERFMADPIHPTLEGYLTWWTPYFEEYLKSYMENK